MSNVNHLRGHEKSQGHQRTQKPSQAVGDTKKNLDEGHLTHGLAGHLTQGLDPEALTALSSLRADLRGNAFKGSETPAEDKGQRDHSVNTNPSNMPLTGDASLAPVVPTGATPLSASERHRKRTAGQLVHSTDPEQPRSDLMKRTRSSLTAEVRRLRRECAKARQRIRTAEDRIKELEGGQDA